jgi:hypothetical protein
MSSLFSENGDGVIELRPLVSAITYKSGRRAHNALTIEQLQARTARLVVPGLRILPETVRKQGSGYFYVMTQCLRCGKRLEKELRNMEKGLSSKCHCMRGGERAGYGDSRAKTLGQRYGAMKQRCEGDTHVSSHNYKGRGIKVLFKSRREFILWALEKWPDVDFKNKDFDRIDNDGHYCPENLRLVDRTANLVNRRDSANSARQKAEDFSKKFPEVGYSLTTIGNMFKHGHTAEQIRDQYFKNINCPRRKITNPLQTRSDLLSSPEHVFEPHQQAA